MIIKTKLHIPIILKFLSEQIISYKSENLILDIKAKHFNSHERKIYGSNTGECVTGLRKGQPYKIHIKVNSGKEYPDNEKWGICLYKNKYVFDSANIFSRDEALAWILGHEFWHYFCYTKQERGNVETKANACGFRWLRAYRMKYGTSTENKISLEMPLGTKR